MALRQPYTVIVLVLFTAVIGYTVLSRMPVDILPQFKTPAVQIVTFYPGMPAEVVEQDMTSRLERWTGQSVGIEHQESKSMLGVSIVKDFFHEDVDPSSAIAQVTSYAMSDLFYLPPGTVPPMVMPFDPTATIPLALLSVSSPTLDETALYDIAYFQLRNRLQGIPGVVAPAVYGGKLRRILAYVDREKLEARGLAPNDVVDALHANNVFIPVGSAHLGAIEYQLDTNALPPTVEEMNAFPVKQEGGALSYVRDVGDMLDSAEIQSNIVRIDGRRQVYIPVYRQPGANTIAVVEGVKKQIATLRTQLPPGVNLDVVFDQSLYVKQSVRSLVFEAALGGVLAAFMILVFLQSARSALFILVTLPLTVLLAFVGLYATGQTINIMTLGGLALVTGLVLDEGIVAIENISRHLEAGEAPFDAALHGMQEMARPRILITLTVMVVFFPVVFLAGLGKFLFAPLAMAVAFAMLGSYLFSMTVVPLCAAKFLRPETHHGGGVVVRRLRGAFERLQAGYGAMLDRALRHRTLTLGAAGLLVALAFLVVLPALGSELFPAVDAGQFMVRVRAPSGTDVKETEKLCVRVEKAVQEIVPPAVLQKLITNIGVLNDWPAAYTPNSGPGDAFVLVQLADRAGRRPVMDYVRELRAALAAQFPGVEFSFDTGGMLSAAVNYGLPSPIDVQVTGKSLDVAQDLAREIRRRVARIPGTADVRIQQRLDAPQYRVEIDREKAALLGVNAGDVVKNVITAFTSSVAFNKGFWLDPGNGNHYFMGAQYPEKAFEDKATIEDVPVRSAKGGAPVPLKNVARLERSVAASEVSHLNIARVTDVYANVDGRDVGGVAADVERVLADVRAEGLVPSGYFVNLRGEAASMKESFSGLGFGLGLSAVLVYLVMVVQFRSFLDPFIVMFAVPLGFVGVAAALWLTGTNLSIQSLVGVIMMIGIVVAFSVLLVDHANRLREGGLSARDAVRGAAIARLRPILMTSLAAILGLLPMAAEGGANIPLARAVIGGAAASTALSLFVVPILYVLLRRARPDAREAKA
ncbi:MAG: efflux RND transporter permease subunit [Planctomycetota bacterium]